MAAADQTPKDFVLSACLKRFVDAGYFEFSKKDSGEKVLMKCLVCSNIIRAENRSGSNLFSHYKARHVLKHEQLKKDFANATKLNKGKHPSDTSDSEIGAQSITKFIKTGASCDNTTTDAVLDFVVEDLRPFSVVEGSGF